MSNNPGEASKAATDAFRCETETLLAFYDTDFAGKPTPEILFGWHPYNQPQMKPFSKSICGVELNNELQSNMLKARMS